MKKSRYRLTLIFPWAILLVVMHVVSSSQVSGQQREDIVPGDTSYFEPGNDDQNLIRSVQKNDPGNVYLLLNRGADPNAVSSAGNPALIYASEKGNLKIIKMLVLNGADVNARGYQEETPLFIAIFKNNFEVTKFLLEEGADSNIRDDYGVTPLLYASATNQYQIADLLIFHGASTVARDEDGNDPLITAVTFDHLATSDVLLQNGLNPDVQDNKGNTPAIISVQHGTQEILKLLVDYDADLNIPNHKNYTPLAYAITYRDTFMVRYLLDNDADVNFQVSPSRSMYELARIMQNDTITSMIRQEGGEPIRRPNFSDFNITWGNSFNGSDYLMQFRAALVDSKYGYFAETGMDYRPVMKKIQTEQRDTVFQYRERRLGWSHGIGKFFTLYESPSHLKLCLYGSLTGYLSFPRYSGTGNEPAAEYDLIPSAGACVMWNYVGIKTGAEYYSFGTIGEQAMKFNISVFFRIAKPGMHYDRKEIYWE